MNDLFKWSIENSESATATSEQPSRRPLNQEALQSLMGGPSDADLMKQSMAAIQSPDVSLENKLIAFDNFEQLIETMDNANNMEPLGLWTPLVGCLGNQEADLRKMAAWCVGTAVQNNVKAQERVSLPLAFLTYICAQMLTCLQLLVVGGVPTLVKLALEDPNELVRRKAIYALSSEIRNYQPALNVAIKALPDEVRPKETANAGDMDEMDKILDLLREKAKIVNA